MVVGAGILSFFSRLGGDRNDHQLCYVTIVMTPPVLPTHAHTHRDIISVHTSYDLVPPFPSFIPPLSLKLPGEKSGMAPVVATCATMIPLWWQMM